MLKLSARKMELRGIGNETSKKGNVYHVLRCENEEGEAFQFFCRSADAFPTGLKKGDIIDVLFEYNSRFKELAVIKVLKSV